MRVDYQGKFADQERIRSLEAGLKEWQRWAGQYCGAPTSDEKTRANIDTYIEELKENVRRLEAEKENTP